MEDTTFDYINVGGGVAGCVLASRLSASLPNKSIHLIEAGPEDADDRVAPSMGVFLSDTNDIQWNHHSIPQKGLDGNTVGCASLIQFQIGSLLILAHIFSDVRPLFRVLF